MAKNDRDLDDATQKASADDTRREKRTHEQTARDWDPRNHEEEQSQQQAKKSKANSRQRRAWPTAGKETRVVAPKGSRGRRQKEAEAEGAPPVQRTTTTTAYDKKLKQQPKADRTVQEAEKYRDENEAKQGEDSGHEWLGEHAVHVAVPQRTDAEDLDGCTAPGSIRAKSLGQLQCRSSHEFHANETVTAVQSPEQRRCRTQLSSSRQLRRH